MNAPPRFELFVLDDGERPVEVTDDSLMNNAATFKVVKQDHTLANLVRSQLLQMPQVLFAGYKVPHPLHPYFLIKVKTDGTITPVEAVTNACTTLIGTLATLQTKFGREFSFKDVEGATVEDPYGVAGSGGQPWAAGKDCLDF